MSRFAASANLQLLQNIVHVILHRADFDAKGAGDFLIRESAFDQFENFALSSR